ADQFVHQQADVAARLLDHQHACAPGDVGTLFEQELLEIHQRDQVAAHVGHAHQPRTRRGDAGHRWRRHQDFADLVDAADEVVLADAEADRTPQARRLDLFGHAGIMLEAAALVIGQQRVRARWQCLHGHFRCRFGAHGGVFARIRAVAGVLLVHGCLQPPAGRCLLTWATRSFSLTGFTSTSLAPWRMPHMRSVSMLLVVTISTGIALVSGSLVRLRVAWNPFMPGMITSISTRSGLVLCAASMPASAVATEVTL